MARYCCYCGALLITNNPSCEACGRAIVRQPTEDEGIETDESDLEDASLEKFTKRPMHLMLPPDHQEMIYGYVERYRGEKVHTFHFCKEADGTFIMAATVSSSGEGPMFFHTRSDLNGSQASMASVPKSKAQANFVAALLPVSYLGTEFVVTTKEESGWAERLLRQTGKRRESGSAKSPPSQLGSDDVLERKGNNTPQLASNDAHGRELALFMFDTNLIGAQPNNVRATVRANPQSESAVSSIRTRVAGRNKIRTAADESLFDRIRGKRDKSYRQLGQNEEDDDEVATFETKRPVWSDAIGGWTLDFNGRVTISSKKNFILVPSEFDEIMFGAETVGVRFGKVSKHRFNLDYRFPFSPLTAFAVGMSMFSSKLTVAW